MNSVKEVELYTDGGCLNNPGPGGYGCVLRYQEHEKRLSGGFRRTTNNRMEVMAVICGLEALKMPLHCHSLQRLEICGGRHEQGLGETLEGQKLVADQRRKGQKSRSLGTPFEGLPASFGEILLGQRTRRPCRK